MTTPDRNPQGGTEANRRPIASRSLGLSQAIARVCARVGIGANTISIIGLACAMLAGALLAGTMWGERVERHFFLAAGLLIPLRLLCNMIDGLVAVECGKGTPTGELYNEVPDRVADAAVLAGAGYAVTSSVSFGYLAALLALFVTYIRVLGRSLGQSSDFRGPMAKQQRMILIIAASLYLALAPASWRVEVTLGNHTLGVMEIALAIISIGCVATAARRLRTLAQRLKDHARAKNSP